MDEYYYHTPYYDQGENELSNWAGYVALILVIIIIIALIVFFVYFGTGGINPPVLRWTIVLVPTVSTIVGTGWTYYIINNSIATATLTPPVDPIGQEFIIDNSGSMNSLVLTLGSSTITIGAGDIATFVWTTATSVSRIS
jgi:hypothetical protein